MYNDDKLSFVATMSIRGYPVTLARGRLATQLAKTDPTWFYFSHHVDHYSISVAGGEHKGKKVGCTKEGYLEVSDKPKLFKLLTTARAHITLEHIAGDQKTVHVQTPESYFVQQDMEGLTAFDDPDVLYNFLLAVPRIDRGNGTYLAREEDEWVPRPVGNPDRTNPAFIDLNILQKGVV